MIFFIFIVFSSAVPVRVFVGETDLPIVQQPGGNPGYVPDSPGEVAQFSAAAEFGTIGLLAHNNLGGERFSDIRYFQRVGIEFSDGNIEYYRVIKIDKFQALSPNSIHSDFLRLPGEEFLTVSDVFYEIYAPERTAVVLQTSIAKGSVPAWGRLFVTAVPESELLNKGSTK